MFVTEEIPVLQQALEVVAEERAALRQEIDAFSRFREAVSHTFPSERDDAASTPTAELVAEYRETVLSTIDPAAESDDALERSLQRELSAGIADAFVSEAPFSNQLKRKVLVQTTTAIDQRRLFHEDLGAEADALETAAADLRDIATKAAALPDCSLENSTLEELLDTWEAYDQLEADCQRVIARRQRQLGEPTHGISVRSEDHALCQYLYEDLETTYPVLATVADICEQIDAARRGATPGKHPL